MRSSLVASGAICPSCLSLCLSELLTVDLDGVPVVSDPLVVKDDIVRSGEELGGQRGGGGWHECLHRVCVLCVMCVGLDPHDETEDMEIYRNEWVMRVARYLAYAVDGGLLGTYTYTYIYTHRRTHKLTSCSLLQAASSR